MLKQRRMVAEQIAAALFEGVITAPRVISAAVGRPSRRQRASGEPRETRLERAPASDLSL